MPAEPNDFGPKNSFGNDSPKKSKGGLIALVIILVLVGAVVVVLAFDVGNVRSEHVAGYLRNAPLIGNLFSEPEIDPLEELTEDELRLAVHVYRDQIASLQAQLAESQENLANANAQNAHLVSFRDRWQEYREASAAFVQMLAHNAPHDFVQFFQAIVDHDLVPQDILAIAFGEAQAIVESDEELMSLVRTFNAREAERVAEDLERMMLIDTALVVRMLRAMGTSRRGEVFDAMDYTTSSTLTLLLSTAPPTFMPLVPPPYLPEILPPIMPVTQVVLPPADYDEYEIYEEYEEAEAEYEEPEEEFEPAPDE